VFLFTLFTLLFLPVFALLRLRPPPPPYPNSFCDSLRSSQAEINQFELQIGVVGQTLLATQTSNAGGDIVTGDDLDDFNEDE